MRALPLLAVLLAIPADPAHGEDGVEFHGELQLRATAGRALPENAVRYDPASNELTYHDYLRTPGERDYLSGLASLGLSGRHLSGALRWVLTADTGELERDRPHRTTQVCWSRITPSGLALPESGDCGHYPLTRVIVPVEDTRLGDPAVTSNGRPLREEAEKTWFIREAYVANSLGRADFLTITAGRKRTTVGDGYVYDDYATGVEVHADLGAIGPQWDLSVGIFDPSRDFPGTAEEISPLVALRANFLPSLFEHAGLFAAGLHERTGSLGNLLRGAIEEHLVVVASDEAPGTVLHQRANQLLLSTEAAPYTSDSTLGWLGTSGSLAPWKGQRLSWTGALQDGELHEVTAGTRGAPVVIAHEVRLRGQLASLRWDSELGRSVSAGASVLYLSGGEMPRVGLSASDAVTPASGTYRGFLGISPYLTETNLFFGGGLSESFADRQATAPGVNGRGVFAPVVNVRLEPSDATVLRAKAAWLRAPVPGPFGGRIYGTEVDLEASWGVTPWLVLGTELDALFPGDFFRGREPFTKGIIALDLVTP